MIEDLLLGFKKHDIFSDIKISYLHFHSVSMRGWIKPVIIAKRTTF